MLLNFDKLSESLVCPKCHNSLVETSLGITCYNCESNYGPNENGYLNFVTDEALASNDAADNDAYVKNQESDAPRLYSEYLEPLLFREPFRRVLNVGCGVGAEIPMLRRKGYEVYGIDLPYASNHWKRLGYDSRYFFCSDASCLPFATGFFDVVYSFGVIEHIGTKIGHCTLLSNYKEIRKQFADELLRVTKWDGRIFINCPNKRFPIDIHGPTDAAGPKRILRSFMHKHTGLTIHRTWGDYFLLSYPEVQRLFCDDSAGRSIEPLSLRNYFSLAMLDHGLLRLSKIFVSMYVSHLPRRFWASCVDPYMCVMIRK